MNRPSSDIIWIAGILEGEGSFSRSKGGNTEGGNVRITLQMTDLDVVQRIRNIMNPLGKIYTIESKIENYRTKYAFQVTGVRAAGWMMTIYSLMGSRRKEKIREILLIWKAFKGMSKKEASDLGVAARKAAIYEKESKFGVPIKLANKAIKACMISRNISREEAEILLEKMLSPDDEVKNVN